MNAAYVEECGSCHVAYAPRLLPAESWKTLLQGLSKHFGVDAALDESELAPIRTYLLKQAGPKPSGKQATAVFRITETEGFRRLHAGVSERGNWPEHKSAANCEACHPDAANGAFRRLSDPNYGIE